MGLILDSSILIAGERRGETVRQVIERVGAAHSDAESALSVISIIELTHGIYRAKEEAGKLRRKAFADELARDMIVHPVSLPIAPLARRIRRRAGGQGRFHRSRLQPLTERIDRSNSSGQKQKDRALARGVFA